MEDLDNEVINQEWMDGACDMIHIIYCGPYIIIIDYM